MKYRYEFDSLGEYVIESNRLGVPLYKRTLDYRRALRITVPNVEYEIIRLDEMEGPFLFWIMASRSIFPLAVAGNFSSR